MINKVSDEVIKNKSYENDFQAIYEADHIITTDEAESLMKKSYFYGFRAGKPMVLTMG